MIFSPLKDIPEVPALVPRIEVRIRSPVALHPSESNDTSISMAHDELPEQFHAMPW